MTLKLHNTLTQKTEPFVPLSHDKVTLYTCGPTVYSYLHIGNWAAYIYWDTLVRALLANGFNVERVMNITDVGHLVSDEDEGDDKMQVGARKEGKSAWELAEFYEKDFLSGMEKLGLIAPEHISKATDFIPQQLELVRNLKSKGFTYQTTDGIYFDISKFPTYADFAHLDLAAQKAGARVTINDEKRQSSDFALWKFSPLDEKRDMEWETPDDLLETKAQDHQQVMGFPGWHLECSAMATTILGTTIDIHTGGIDHIPVHHTNEIAQSEAASGQLLATTWLHNNHLKVEGTKISKSLGNGYTLSDLYEKGFSPMDYRMFVLQGHFSNEGNFTFDNLSAAKNRLSHWRQIAALRHQTHDTLVDDGEKANSDITHQLLAASQAIVEALNSNLNTPEALRIIDEVFSSLDGLQADNIHRHSLTQLIESIDELLGLQLQASTPDIDDSLKQKILERQHARANQDWQTSDRLRDELLSAGIVLKDYKQSVIWQYGL